MAEEATVNPDGSSTFETPPGGAQDVPPPGGDGGGFEDSGFEGAEETLKAAVEEGVDPAVYFLIGIALLGLLYYFFLRPKKDEDESDDFFSQLDGEKVST